MKTRTTVLISFLVFGVLIVAGSCATRKIAISDEELSNAYTSTWINEEYEDNPNIWAKIVLFSDGTWESYEHLDIDKYPLARNAHGKNIILDKWRDSEGNIFFECIWERTDESPRTGYMLVKLSGSGNTMEELYTYNESVRVESWDPENLRFNYRIYYRQK